ncbi:MAG: transaldolase [Acidobacteria bacterium]|nr:MAG: transaldolase [Acidobacteriota bacterium]
MGNAGVSGEGSPIARLRARGQSVWLDYIQRNLILSGRLAQMIGDGLISGVTSNPSIFRKAISESDDYESDLVAMAKSGVTDPYIAFVSAGGEDIKLAAQVLNRVYEESSALDGYVSLEVPPALADDYEGTVDEARRLFGLIGRPNVMIKVPGTDAGAKALEDLIAEGVNVNQTLLFGVGHYERSAEAYLRGLERRLDAGEDLSRVASVASFFVSRLDTAIDNLLPEGSALRGKAAIANTCLAYRRFREIFAGARWERLVAAGARYQRPLWASTSTKNPAYPDTLYVDALIAPDTVNTLPEVTLNAFAEHGDSIGGIDDHLASTDDVLKGLADAGVDLNLVTERLLAEGLEAFAADFDTLLDRIGELLKVDLEGAPELGKGD